MKKTLVILTLSLIGLVVSCTVTKNDGLDKNAKMFLTEFQKTLSKTDEEVLALFKSAQSKEEILKGIAVLQNKDTTFLKTVLVYDEAKAVWEEGYLKVSIPVQLIGQEAEAETSTLTLSLFQKKDGKFYINKLGGQEVYTAYYSIKSKIENADELARRLADVKIYYDRARELQKDYDTVVWYVHHNDTAYYYAVNGKYIYDSLNGKSPATFKMGLVHTSGKVVVPVEFDLVGNPSINLPNAVEVKKDGKIGYYGMDGNQLVPVEYTWLVPYEEGAAKALVKKDTLFGWLDKSYQYHENFPTAKAEKYIKDFEYLTEKKFVFGSEYQEIIQRLVEMDESFQYIAKGQITYPAFLVKNGICEWVADGFITKSDFANNTFEGGTDFFEMVNGRLKEVRNATTGFITNFKSRFIGGRSEFYISHKVTVLDNNLNLLSSLFTYGDVDFQFRKINDSLYESSFLNDPNSMSFEINERNFRYRNYFKFNGNRVVELESNRRFKFTQFLKLDSSYLSGKYVIVDVDTRESSESSFLTDRTLKLMRNEILASYGYIFNDPTIAEDDANSDWRSWYKPTIASYDEVYSMASEIDKYNLDFLAKILGPVKKPI